MLLRARRTPPLFPPIVWNVYDATLAGRQHINNVCEGWNHAFANMVGHHYPSLWCLLGALQQDQVRSLPPRPYCRMLADSRLRSA